jgi:hypothetical protein
MERRRQFFREKQEAAGQQTLPGFTSMPTQEQIRTTPPESPPTSDKKTLYNGIPIVLDPEQIDEHYKDMAFGNNRE